MRIILYIVGFILSCLLGFLLFGLFKPVISYDISLQINRPIAKCWTVYQTDSLKSKWMPGYLRTTLLTGTSNAVGSRNTIFYQSGEQETSMIQTIDSLINESLIAYTIDNRSMHIRTHIRFAPSQANACIMQIHNEVTANNIFLKSLLTFMKAKFESAEQTNYQNLKTLIESKEVEE
jgi:hypothetical protein